MTYRLERFCFSFERISFFMQKLCGFFFCIFFWKAFDLKQWTKNVVKVTCTVSGGGRFVNWWCRKHLNNETLGSQCVKSSKKCNIYLQQNYLHHRLFWNSKNNCHVRRRGAMYSCSNTALHLVSTKFEIRMYIFSLFFYFQPTVYALGHKSSDVSTQL